MVVLSCFPPPTEGVRHKEPNTAAFIESRDLGVGTLYIAESRVSWMSNDGNGFSLEYPAVSLHAISKDLSSFPHECLYVMVEAVAEASAKDKVGRAEADRVADDMAVFSLKSASVAQAQSGGTKDINATGQTNGDSNGHTQAEDEQDEDEPSKITEIRFVPADKNSLNAIFQAMSDCQALHPDENDSFSDEDGEGCEEESEFFSTADAVGYLNAEGQATLGRLSQAFELANEGNADEEMGDAQVGHNGHPVDEEHMEGQFDDADG